MLKQALNAGTWKNIPSFTYLPGLLKASLGIYPNYCLWRKKTTRFLLCQGCWQEEHNKIWQQLSVYRPQIMALNEHAVEMPRESTECLGNSYEFFLLGPWGRSCCPGWYFSNWSFFFPLNLERWWKKRLKYAEESEKGETSTYSQVVLEIITFCSPIHTYIWLLVV